MYTKTPEVVSEATLSIKQQSGTKSLNDTLMPLQTRMNIHVWTHYCTHTTNQASRQSQAHFSARREAAMSSLVNRNDKAADCQDEYSDSCTVQLPGTSTRAHLPRHPTGMSHYSPCQDMCHWDSPLFPLPSREDTHTLRSKMKAVYYVHTVARVYVISSETHKHTNSPVWRNVVKWLSCLQLQTTSSEHRKREKYFSFHGTKMLRRHNKHRVYILGRGDVNKIWLHHNAICIHLKNQVIEVFLFISKTEGKIIFLTGQIQCRHWRGLRLLLKSCFCHTASTDKE